MPGGGDTAAEGVSLPAPSSPELDPTSPNAELARVVRDHAGRLAAALVRVTGDFATAEDLVQDAVMTALRRWPHEGIPARPDAWLFTVARNRGLDLLRRQANYRAKLAQLQWPVQPEPDERLRLIFTCCHPALPRSAQIALTLRVVCGFTTAQIAHAFLVPETTVAQRITRTKRKITDAGIPYRVPDPDELGSRLAEVLAVIYLLLNEGYLSTTDRVESRDLVEEAEWLAALLDQLMPTEPEVAGLLALIRLHRARADARFDPSGAIVLLEDQDRSRWNREAIADADRLLERAARQHRPGPYQLQAATRRLRAGPTPTGNRSCCSTTCCCIWRRRPSPASTAPSPCTTPPVRAPPSPSSTRWPASSTPTTSTTPRVPSSCAPWAAPAKRVLPIGVPSGSHPTPPSNPCCANASAGRSGRLASQFAPLCRLVLGQALDTREARVPFRGNIRHPAHRQIEPIRTHGEFHLLAMTAALDQSGPLEHGQVLRDALAANGQPGRQARGGRFSVSLIDGRSFPSPLPEVRSGSATAKRPEEVPQLSGQ
jgi:RNA polymerase sigma factor (sigma-70 family)